MRRAKNAQTATIYKLLDPRNEKVRYVGCSANVQRRYKQHLCPADWRTDLIAQWVRLLASKGLKPQLVVIQEVVWERGEETEQYWIDRYRADGHKLYNADSPSRSTLICAL